MDFITSIKQLSLHLTNLEKNQFIDEALLEENKRNLSNSLIESDLCLEDHSVSRFFLQLHQLTETSCRNGKSFRQLLLILEELVENQKTRSHLQQLDFIPLLANATEIEYCDDVTKILGILEKLTKDCRIETPELFLITFIPFLVTSIERNDPEKLQSRLCLSILINLCENRHGMDTLLKFCSTKELHKKFQSFGFLTIKMHYLIESFYNNTKTLEFTASAVFNEIDKLIAEMDAKMCLECFRFIEEFSKQALENCRMTFEEELGKLLERLIGLLKSEDSRAEAIVAGGLKMFASLIKFNNSLVNFHEPLLDFALESFCTESAFHVQSLNLLESLGVKNSKLETSERLTSVWTDIARCLTCKISLDKQLAILRVFHVFVLHSTHQANILNCVNRMSLHELLHTPDNMEVECMKDDQILVILMTLELLATFATVEPQEWYGQTDEVFKRPDMIEIMAEGFVRKNEEMFRCCLDLAKFTNFPTKKISTILHESPVRLQKQMRQLPPEETFSPLRVLQRQSDEIDRILKDFHQTPDSLSTSSAASLFQYQDVFMRTKEKLFEQQLEEGRRSISALKQHIVVMEMERSRTRTLICQNDIAREKDRKELKKCEKTIEELQQTLTQLTKKSDNIVQELEKASEAYTKKVEECDQLKEQLEDYAKESREKVKKLKEKITMLDTKMLQQQEANEYQQKVIDEMKKEATKKNARIQHLEEKMKESENIKQKIAHLMNGL